MSQFTAKTIHLQGDKRIKTEPAQHIITFPGGSVEVSRCEDGTYWAHITRNRADQHPPEDVGVFLSGRMDGDGPKATHPVPIPLDDFGLYHVAMLIGNQRTAVTTPNPFTAPLSDASPLTEDGNRITAAALAAYLPSLTPDSVDALTCRDIAKYFAQQAEAQS